METRNLRKERTGVVVSNKMDKSITIEIVRRVKHPFTVSCEKTNKLWLNDENNDVTLVIQCVLWKHVR